MMIINELRKHGRLAAKRHPMYEYSVMSWLHFGPAT